MRSIFLSLVFSALSFGQCGPLAVNPVTLELNCTGPASTATGTVTSIATTSPITGGTITTTGTIACPTCALTNLSNLASVNVPAATPISTTQGTLVFEQLGGGLGASTATLNQVGLEIKVLGVDVSQLQLVKSTGAGLFVDGELRPSSWFNADNSSGEVQFITSSGGGIAGFGIAVAVLKAGLTINQAGVARPTCVAAYRGSIWYEPGGAGVADAWSKCSKDVADAYAWSVIL